MLDINPVSAAPDTTATPNNIVRSADTVDPRRYSQFDRTATEAGSTSDFSFSDLLDLVNPLQHIPVVSSIYRAITDESINPVSRITGDILYGGLLGAASAIISGISAAGDAVVEAQTGKDMAGYVMASLFGSDQTSPPIQLAQNEPSPAATSAVATSTSIPAIAGSAQIPFAPINTPQQTVAAATTTTGTTDTTAPAKGIPLNRNKLPYGGVMDPSVFQNQNTTMALSEASHTMRLGHTIYTSPLMNGPHPLPVAPPLPAIAATDTTTTPTGTGTTAGTTSVSAAAPSATPTTINAATTPSTSTSLPPVVTTGSLAALSMGSQKNPLPQNLIDDMIIMKALNQYRGFAAGPANVGANLNTVH